MPRGIKVGCKWSIERNMLCGPNFLEDQKYDNK